MASESSDSVDSIEIDTGRCLYFGGSSRYLVTEDQREGAREANEREPLGQPTRAEFVVEAPFSPFHVDLNLFQLI